MADEDALREAVKLVKEAEAANAALAALRAQVTIARLEAEDTLHKAHGLVPQGRQYLDSGENWKKYQDPNRQ